LWAGRPDALHEVIRTGQRIQVNGDKRIIGNFFVRAPRI